LYPLLPLAVDLWCRQFRTAALLAVVLFMGLVTISVGSTLGALSIVRDRVVADAAATRREGDLRAELADAASSSRISVGCPTSR
jgi:hypothetical protein